MAKDETRALDREAIVKDDKLYVDGQPVDPMPASADTLASCDATGPFKGVRCNEPVGHVGDHQHHADDGRAVWAGGD